MREHRTIACTLLGEVEYNFPERVRHTFDVKMKRLIQAIVILLVVAWVTAWLTFNLRAKQKYELARSDLSQFVLEVVPFNEDTTRLLAEVRSNWTISHSDIEGPHSDALMALGMSPSVANLVRVFTCRLPEYSFSSSVNQKKKSASMAAIQAILMPITVDGSIHLSDNGQLALVRCHPQVVYIFSDEARGLRESLYHLKQEPSNKASHPIAAYAAQGER